MDIDKYKKAIKQVTQWDLSERAFGFINFDQFKGNFIFEFYCAMRILSDLNKIHKLYLVPNHDGDVVFPRSHANKDGYSHIRVMLRENTEEFLEVWLGANIGHSLHTDYTHAPDVSFQTKNAPKLPTEEHLLMMIDMKYYKDGIEIDTIDSFIAKIKRFGFPKKGTLYDMLEFSEFDFLTNPAIITNSKVHFNSKTICKMEGLIQIGQFNPDQIFLKIGAV